MADPFWTTQLPTREDLARLDEVACLKQANESPAVKAIDAKLYDLARNWKPTGYYTLKDLTAITGQILASTAQAKIVVATETIVGATSDGAAMARQATVYLDRNVERANLYVEAARKAAAAGQTIVHAPGLKDVVLKSMVNISHGYTTVAAINCRANFLDRAAVGVGQVWAVAKSVVGVAADLALAAAGGVYDAATGLWAVLPYLKWVAIIGGLGLTGLWAYDKWGRFVVTQRALRSEDPAERREALRERNEEIAAERVRKEAARERKATAKAARQAIKAATPAPVEES